MGRKMRRLLVLATSVVLVSGCSLLEQFTQMGTFARCQFRLLSVENQAIAGIVIAGKRSARDFQLADGLRLRAALVTATLPLEFTVNVEVQNPNSGTAAMNRMEWILLVDGNELVRGSLDKRVEVAANGTAPMPLQVSVDLRKALSGKSLDAMMTLAFNVAGEGTHPTRVSLKAKPTIMVAGREMVYPDYITITAEYGGGAGTPK